MSEQGRVIAGFDDLSDAEYSVLMEALDGHRLTDTLNGWVTGEDAPYWNRKAPYVAKLIPAAVALLRAGLIEVWEEPEDGIGEGGVVLGDAAEAVLADATNWWRYDPDANWDPNEDPSRSELYERQAPTTPWLTYLVLSTEDAQNLARASRTRARDLRPYPDPANQKVGYGLDMRWELARKLLADDHEQAVLCPENLDAVMTVTPTPRTEGDARSQQENELGEDLEVVCPSCRACRVLRIR